MPKNANRNSPTLFSLILGLCFTVGLIVAFVSILCFNGASTATAGPSAGQRTAPRFNCGPESAQMLSSSRSSRMMVCTDPATDIDYLFAWVDSGPASITRLWRKTGD